ncbi:dehydrogenase [Streptomyces mashuensis]|uniref:Dehydrogenase n=1 Tax=Streptomyces mashuensis TaxID=33904 RepID=A0A919B792_9ACTN|nr:NADH-quinone oxidoreductase subunit C [Streptomyces mashuensis]GHF56977.1 dehydrogenase [Streptomyces mashuensis]
MSWLPASVEELFGEGATEEEAYDLLTVDVPASSWLAALTTARDRLTCTYFDWLSAVDEPGTGFRVCAHVAALSPVRRLLLRTTVPHGAPVLPSAVDVYAGAAWHERETHEMFGVTFEGHPHLAPLLLPDGFEGHPLRKDFVLAARVAKAWPGAKEPGESAEGGPKRRQMLPPGVPDPNEWGPLKGQLPPAPARPARTARAAAGERPVRRTRSVTEGSASQAPETAAPESAAPAAPRRTRSASEGSASQAAPRRMRSASEGSASQTQPESAPPRRARSAGEGSASRRTEGAGGTPAPERPRPAPRSSDAPWHHARPAYDAGTAPEEPQAGTEPAPAQADAPAPEPTAPPAPEAHPAHPAPEAPQARPRTTGDAPENDTDPAGGDSA